MTYDRFYLANCMQDMKSMKELKEIEGLHHELIYVFNANTQKCLVIKQPLVLTSQIVQNYDDST